MRTSPQVVGGEVAADAARVLIGTYYRALVAGGVTNVAVAIGVRARCYGIDHAGMVPAGRQPGESMEENKGAPTATDALQEWRTCDECGSDYATSVHDEGRDGWNLCRKCAAESDMNAKLNGGARMVPARRRAENRPDFF